MLCKIHRATNTSKVIDNIAKRYGHEVLPLPPYHCDLNSIELIWADEKNFVAPENKEMTLESVEKLFLKRRAEITAEMCKKCVEHVEHVELSYWKTDRIIDLKMDNLKYHLMQMKKKVILNSTVIKTIFNFLMCTCELII